MFESIDSLAQAKRILRKAENDCAFGPQRAYDMMSNACRYIQKQIDELAAPIFEVAADEAVSRG